MWGLPKGGFHVHAHTQGIGALVLETLFGGWNQLTLEGIPGKAEDICSEDWILFIDDEVQMILLKV